MKLSELGKAIEETKFTGDIYLRVNDGGIGSFKISITEKNIKKCKFLLDKLKKENIKYTKEKAL